MPTKRFSDVSRVLLIIAGLLSITLAILMFIFVEFGVYFAVWMVIFGLLFNGFAGAFWAAGSVGSQRAGYGAYGGFSGGFGFFFLIMLLFGIWIPGFVIWFALWMFAFSLIFFGILNIVFGASSQSDESSGLKGFRVVLGIIIASLGVCVLIFPVFGYITMFYVTAFNLIFMGMMTIVWGIKGSHKVSEAPPPPKSVPVCSNCGAVIKGRQKFCPECGAQIVGM